MSEPATSASVHSLRLSEEQSTRVRWHILALLMALCFLSHFNRVSMSVAGNDRIMEQYSISPTKMGAVYSAFLLVYSIGMIPGGFYIDRCGARVALITMGFGTALFGALTGGIGFICHAASQALAGLIVVRSLMGLSATPLHPGSARAVGNWFPFSERGRANGLVTGAAIIGVAASYKGFGALIHWFDWPVAFLITGGLMAALSLLFALYATEQPAQHRWINRREQRLIAGNQPGAENASAAPAAGWWSLLTNRSLLLLTLSYAAVGYFQYLFVYWMQYYFDKELHLGEKASHFYAGIPQLAMALTMPCGGWLADRLQRSFGPRLARGLVSASGMVAGAALLGLGILAREPLWIVTWFTLALGSLGVSEAPFWATAVELGGRRGGTAAAICNTGGNLGGMLAPVLTPLISGAFGWAWGISLGGAICLLGAVCWRWIDPATRQE